VNRLERWLPISGLLAVVSLALTGFLSTPPPIAGAPFAEIVNYYARHHVGLEAESVADGIGVTLLVLFAATFHARVRSIPSLLAFIAAAIIAACTLIEVAAFQALAYRPNADAARAAVLNDFQSFAFQVTTFPALLFLGAAAVAIFRSATLPNWLGLAAGIGAVLQAVSWVSFFAQPGPLAAGSYPDIVAFGSLLGWLVACSVAMVSLPSLGAAGSGTYIRNR
jgi:hypothetical protein